METSLFDETSAGRLVPTIGGVQAFVPDKLPPRVDLRNVINEFGEASAALGGLREIGRTISNPHMVIRPLQRNEALRSSAMEGTYSTADDLALAEALNEANVDHSTMEVLNYVRAIEYAVEELKTLPISHRVIKGMHGILLAQSTRVRGSTKRPGEYKIHQNWIGDLQIENARFVPPPPEQAARCMDDLEAFMNADAGSMPDLIAIGLCHYQFETIHPFADGNGRVGRMLITLQLIDRGLLSGPLLYVSPHIEENKDEYIDAMFAVSRHGDWERWLRFFLRAIKESCDETARTIGRLNDLRERYRAIIQEGTRSTSALTIVDHLFARPVISIMDASRLCEISYKSAKANVDRLVEFGILRQVPEIENPRLFRAREIIDVSGGRRTAATS